MSKKNASLPDPMRRMALLWGSQTEPGRSGLTVRAIVTTAIQLADEQGVESLSMRQVAERLGVGTMSLYTHVPGKSELIDLMLDTVYGEVYTHVDEPSQHRGDWRAALRFIARRNWELYHRHPWMLQAINGRPVLGPHEVLKYEAELRPLDGLGLSDIDMDAALTLIQIHVQGCARLQVGLDRTQHETGQTDVEWWLAHEPALNRVLNPALFPVAARVGTASGEAYQAPASPEYAFTFGLECILAGISALIAG